jgi:mRNA interferase YafQ
LGEVLPEESKDHALVGNWEGYREFHLSGDVLIIYKVTEGEIILTRMGSHAQLFE